MRLPSASICVDSVIDRALYGLFFTTGPVTLPAGPRTSICAPNAGSGATFCKKNNVSSGGVCGNGGSAGAGACALAAVAPIPHAATNKKTNLCLELIAILRIIVRQWTRATGPPRENEYHERDHPRPPKDRPR